MSNISSISFQGDVLAEASQWIYRLDRGLSPDEEAKLDKWLNHSEQHCLALIKVGQVWDKTEVLTKLAELFPEQVETKSPEGWSRWKVSAIAASFLLVFFSVWLTNSIVVDTQIFTSDSELAISNPESLYKTAVGEHTRVNLPDGTEMFLNTNTTVRVNYSDEQRLLILEQGEFHVQVAHDENRPLSVLAARQVVQAVGTAFNVELNADRSVNLVVIEGKVLVGSRDETPVVSLAIEDPAPIFLPLSSLEVSQGERVLLGQVDEQVEPIALEEIEIQLSWRQGNIIFRGEPLEEAVREISRYTSAEFIFLDESLKQVKVAGLFETGDVDGLLAALNDSFQIDSQRIDHRILLSSR